MYCALLYVVFVHLLIYIGVGFRVVRFDKLGNARAFEMWSEQQASTPRFLCAYILY